MSLVCLFHSGLNSHLNSPPFPIVSYRKELVRVEATVIEKTESSPKVYMQFWRRHRFQRKKSKSTHHWLSRSVTLNQPSNRCGNTNQFQKKMPWSGKPADWANSVGMWTPFYSAQQFKGLPIRWVLHRKEGFKVWKFNKLCSTCHWCVQYDLRIWCMCVGE